MFSGFPDAYLSIWSLAQFFSIRFFLEVYGKALSQRPDHYMMIWKTFMNLFESGKGKYTVLRFSKVSSIATRYGVAWISRLLKMLGLFCKRDL